jgi:hypothetical protein
MTLMTNLSRAIHTAAVAAGAALSLAACNMDVANPSVIDASTFDPNSDASLLSLSAQSNLHRAVSNLVHWSGFFSQEVWVGAVRAETNDIGRRAASAATSDVNSALWVPLQRALATNDLTLELLEAGPNAASDVNLARAAMNSGFSLVLLAEHFCQGAIRGGPPRTPAEMLDTAILRFTRAKTVGAAVTGTAAAEGTKIVNASNVGLARAHLQKKEYAQAATAAALVPASFVYNAVNVDDASNRGLSNLAYNYDLSALIVVPDAYRALGDPRVPWRDAGIRAQDVQLQYYQQLKYASYAAPIRIASGLEASYIAAEARLQTGDPAPALALIASRRAANGQAPFTGAGDAAILAELMDQRAREFWLEAKHTGDWIRNPTATPYVPATGSPFYKAPQGNFGDAMCLPVPLAEVAANPNFPEQ